MGINSLKAAPIFCRMKATSRLPQHCQIRGLGVIRRGIDVTRINCGFAISGPTNQGGRNANPGANYTVQASTNLVTLAFDLSEQEGAKSVSENEAAALAFSFSSSSSKSAKNRGGGRERGRGGGLEVNFQTGSKRGVLFQLFQMHDAVLNCKDGSLGAVMDAQF